MQQETVMPPESPFLLHRRYDRMGRLLGDAAMERLFNSHVMVIGLGGVGSWAAESLVRSGVGTVTLVDFDAICITNTNRQLHAMHGMIGKKKALVMQERLHKINPQADVREVPVFYSQETSAELFDQKPDIILDAIDNVTTKAHLIAGARQRGVPLIVSGGAGSLLDPLQIKVEDLAQTRIDPLCAVIRRILRTEYDFPRQGDLGIKTVFSTERQRQPQPLAYDEGKGFRCVCPRKNPYHNCDNRNVIHGTASFVTGTFGFVMASVAVRELIADVAG